MERYTEYHAGVPVLKDKTRMKEAMARFAELEERDTAKKPELINGIAVCPECGATISRTVQTEKTRKGTQEHTTGNGRFLE